MATEPHEFIPNEPEDTFECQDCHEPKDSPVHRVPAPPTRTEEPRKLVPEKLGRLRMGRATPAEQQEAYVRVDFIERDRDRLREQIETMRHWLNMNASPLRENKLITMAYDKFNATFPAEKGRDHE